MTEAHPREDTAERYDTVPYWSRAFSQTHPARLTTIGTLFGMDAPPIERCRVLELGCSDGGNLIPMAARLPRSEFVGIDVSAVQVEAGRAAIANLGLTNLALEALNLSDLDASFGEFDYIIAHGVYSWVPEPVRDQLLAICRQNLSASGIAYVSYNTYPGWHWRGIARELVRYRAQQASGAQAQIQAARELADELLPAFASEAQSAEGGAYATLISQELERLRDKDDAYLFHEYLEADNDPVYFHQFVERASARGLQYLGEAEFKSMFAGEGSAAAAQALDRLAPDLIQAEQYRDILYNRTFRQTLLCHQEVSLQRRLSPKRVKPLAAASQAQPTTEASDHQAVTFADAQGNTLTTQAPIAKAALLALADTWPQALPFPQLLEKARSRLLEREDPAREERQLAGQLLQGYSVGLVALHGRALPLAATAGPYPMADAVSRYQAQRNGWATNRRHQSIDLAQAESQLLALLDGSRDRADLAAALGEPPECIEQRLARLARDALLVA
jgi:methyltransferase-like protein/2-polyprenyl-3-methyl-5-hydroxy-6-metoxy-1,4-benzoquinol methylase